MFAKQLSPRPLIGKGVAKANSAASSHWLVVKHPEGGAPQTRSRKTRPSLLTRNKKGEAVTRAGILSSKPMLFLTAQAWVS